MSPPLPLYFLSPSQPPAPIQGTENSTGWRVEFRKRGGPSFPPRDFNATTLTTSFGNGVEGLEKGTLYEARVRGENSRGHGDFSEYIAVETLVDCKLSPCS